MTDSELLSSFFSLHLPGEGIHLIIAVAKAKESTGKKRSEKKKKKSECYIFYLSTDAHNLWPIIIWRTYNSFLKSTGYLLCIMTFKWFYFFYYFYQSLTFDISFLLYQEEWYQFSTLYFVILEPLRKDAQGCTILLKWNSSCCFFWMALIKCYRHAWFLQASLLFWTKNILCKYKMCMHFISPFAAGKVFSAYVAGWFHDILTHYCICFIQMYHNSSFVFIGLFNVLWIWQSDCCGFFSISITWRFELQKRLCWSAL